jgi:outer membrane protein OmpA-like peptidoglycan-associated protein
MNKIVRLVGLSALCLLPSAVSFAQDPDISQLQQSLAAEQQKLAELAKAADKAAANQQRIKILDQQNRELTAALAATHEQIQLAESKAATAEDQARKLADELAKANARADAAAAERDHARVDLATLKQLIAKAAESAGQTGEPASTAPEKTVQPEPPLATTHPAARQAKSQKAQAPAKKAPPIKKVVSAAAEPGPTDERAILGGRSAAMSFEGLSADRREEARRLVGSLNTTADERGLVTLLPDDLLFAPGSDLLEPPSHDVLEKVAQLVKLLHNQDVRIVGHTEGDPKLGQEQAMAVSQYLIDRNVQARRLAVDGAGDAQAGAGRVDVIIQN